jgi:hypothetical protein
VFFFLGIYISFCHFRGNNLPLMHFDLIQSIRDSDYRYLFHPWKLKCACSPLLGPCWRAQVGAAGLSLVHFISQTWQWWRWPTCRREDRLFILIRLTTSNLYTKAISIAGLKCYGVLLQRNVSVSRCAVFVWQLKPSCLLTQYRAYKDRPMQVNCYCTYFYGQLHMSDMCLFIWYHFWRR